MDVVSVPPTPDVLMLDWDRQRERSQQRELGMSAVGGCRRFAAYTLAGYEPTNPGGSLQAVMGTAIHLVLADAARKRAGDRDLIEAEVSYGGLLGHVDWVWVDPDTGDAWVIDWKSVSFPRYDQAENDGPDLNQLFQTVLYAAAVARLGYRVRWIVLDYIGRDSGKLHRHVRPFRIEEVREALAWFARVREAVETVGVEATPRDFRPGSVYCDGCAFYEECWSSARPGRNPRSALFIDHPDAAAWLAQLLEGMAMKAAGERLYDDAKGALDAIRPNDVGKSPPCIIDGPDGELPAIRWSVYEQERLDQEKVRADYAAAGLEPPVTRGEVVKVSTPARPKPKATGG